MFVLCMYVSQCVCKRERESMSKTMHVFYVTNSYMTIGLSICLYVYIVHL